MDAEENNEASNINRIRTASEQGDAKSQFDLGWYYYITQNTKEAIKWFRKAAEQGLQRAQVILDILEANSIQTTESARNPNPRSKKLKVLAFLVVSCLSIGGILFYGVAVARWLRPVVGEQGADSNSSVEPAKTSDDIEEMIMKEVAIFAQKWLETNSGPNQAGE